MPRPWSAQVVFTYLPKRRLLPNTVVPSIPMYERFVELPSLGAILTSKLTVEEGAKATVPELASTPLPTMLVLVDALARRCRRREEEEEEEELEPLPRSK